MGPAQNTTNRADSGDAEPDIQADDNNVCAFVALSRLVEAEANATADGKQNFPPRTFFRSAQNTANRDAAYAAELDIQTDEKNMCVFVSSSLLIRDKKARISSGESGVRLRVTSALNLIPSRFRA
ncbi:MAG: hypothetical protein O7E52_21735 [Candidatus Poribacteria bacterium]|nr:hypothetical protein [Candidatus Poribacteria bacterium]